MNNTELPTGHWRTSSYSGEAGNCVEVASSSAAVSVRDTKRREGGNLTVSTTAWSHFLTDLTR